MMNQALSRNSQNGTPAKIVANIRPLIGFAAMRSFALKSNVRPLCYNKSTKQTKGHNMSLTLANSLYTGCLFIWKGKNYLFKEFTNIVDESEIVNAIIIDHTGKELSLICSYDEFKESVVK